MDLDSGDILITTNGDFMIIQVEVASDNEYFGWAAMYVDSENEYPYEIQFMNEELDELIQEIEQTGTIVDILRKKRGE